MKMAQSGAVYQPTTVTYEGNTLPQDRWAVRPMGYLSSLNRRPGNACSCLRNLSPTVLLTGSLTCFAVGLFLVIIGIFTYLGPQGPNDFFYLIIAFFGTIFIGVGVLLLGRFLRQSRRLCWRNGKDPLDPATGQALTVNPSTDLLVAAQYAPVSEVTYQPPAEDTEQSKLMPQENKESNEDTDRMVESDPRIVLRPLNPPTHEET